MKFFQTKLTMVSVVTTMSVVAAVTPPSLSLQTENHLRKLSSAESSDLQTSRSNGAFIDGTETVFDDYSLAWRFLGFYTDCNMCLEEEGSGDGDENGDEDEQFESTPSKCVIGNNDKDSTVCRRFALWAAYVDEGYEGHGVSEYQHYDRRTRRWDTSGCQENSNNDEERCVKMDCHDPYSQNFKLIGLFKDHKTNDFLQNMINYSGDCVWNDDEYKFMKAMNSKNEKNGNGDGQQQNVAYWPPRKCTAFKNDEDGMVYYYDAVPSHGGNLGVGLFEDDSCTIPLPKEGGGKGRKKVTAEKILGRVRSSSGSSYNKNKNKKKFDKKNTENFVEEMKSWNNALDAFKICQPCVSYDARLILDDNQGTAAAAYNANGDRYGENDAGEEDNDSFVCKNNLQRENPINQCRVFVQNGRNTMTAATYRDILLAESQGAVTGIDVSTAGHEGSNNHIVLGEPFIQPKHTFLSVFLLLLSMGYFGAALTRLFKKERSKNVDKNGKKQRLMILEYEKDNKKESDRSDKPRNNKSILKKSRSKNDDGSYDDDDTYYSHM